MPRTATAPPKKTGSKTAATKKTATKKPAAKRTTASPARKAPAVKAPLRKAAVSKPVQKRAPAKQTPAKKAVPVAAKKSTPARKPTAAKTKRTPPPVQMPLSRALRDLYATHRQGLAPIWDPNTGLTVALRVPASTSLAPQRTRCKACSKGLGDLVVLRMFCSYACAGLPVPDFNPETAPRMCKRAARSDEKGNWVLKQAFTSGEAAQRYLKPGMTTYRCANCFGVHLGNVSAPPQTGVPSAPKSATGDLFADCVLAVLHARGESPDKASAVAAAKRDARAVLDVVQAASVSRR